MIPKESSLDAINQGVSVQKNTYKFRRSLAEKVIDHLKKCNIDAKSVLIGATMTAIAGSTAPGVFASFSETEAYKRVARNVDLTNAETSKEFFAARFGLLKDDFQRWGLADETGWTVAHEAALFQNLPEDFPHMEMADRRGVTVADALAEGKRNSKLYYATLPDDRVDKKKHESQMIPGL